MARTGAEALGSMGTDTPVAVLSQRPADALRLLPAAVRPGDQPAAGRHPRRGGDQPPGHRSDPRATCSTRTPNSCRQIVLPQPILRNADLSKLICVDPDHEVRGHKHGMRAAVDPLPVPGQPAAARACKERAGQRPRQGLGRRSATAPASSCCPTASPTSTMAPIPSLLLGVRGAPPSGPRAHPHQGRPRGRGR